MDSALSAPTPRRLFLAGLLVVAAALAFQAGKMWLADRWTGSGELASLKKGAALLPGNAEAWDRLGHYYRYSFFDTDIPAAVANFQRATQVNRLSSNYWLDLGEAYDANSQPREAEQAYEHARDVDPKSAVVALNYGYFLIREGRNQDGYEELRRAVQTDPLQLPLIVRQVWHSSHDANELLDHVVPADVESYLAVLDFFASIHNAPPGMAVWERLIAAKKPFPLERAFPFLDELIQENDADNARRVWSEAVSVAGDSNLEIAGDSLICDGRFQTDFPDGGLGWRWLPDLGMTINFDGAPSPGKGRTVRIDFNGGVNSDLKHPSQYVAVQPGQTYHFHALLRTEDITTESGMRFRISDPAHPEALNLETDNLTGSQPWTNVDQDVATPADAHFLLIELFRSPSRRFENKLGGTVWIGDVSLIATKPSAKGSAQ